MPIDDVSEATTCKYVVAPGHGVWRVTRHQSEIGVFAGQGEATDFACALARDYAHAGVLGIVVVESNVQELHCFTPDRTAPPPTRRLRLIDSNCVRS